MDTQMGPTSTNSTQGVILGHAAGNTSKAKQSTVGQDATKHSRGAGVNPGGSTSRGGGERDVPDPSRTHPVTARREEEEKREE